MGGDVCGGGGGAGKDVSEVHKLLQCNVVNVGMGVHTKYHKEGYLGGSVC